MSRIFAFTGLLALQFVLCICGEPEVVIFYDGSNMLKLLAPKAEEEVIECSISATSLDKTYQLFPDNKFPGAGFHGYEGESCGIDWRSVPLKYAGVWTISTKTANPSTSFDTKFIVKGEQKVVPSPANNVYAQKGLWATVWLDGTDTDDLNICEVTTPKFKKIDIMKEKIKDATRVNGCGFKIRVTEETIGQWTFTSETKNYQRKTGIFHLNSPYAIEDNEILHRTWELGKIGKLELSENGMLFCQLTRPDGSKVPLIFGRCVYEIKAVSAYHGGVWKASIAKNHNMELITREIHVKTKNPNSLEITATYVGNSVNLLCKTGQRNLNFCTFIRPDKHILNIPAGVGNEKYSYYGKGYQDQYTANRQFGDCGMTIHNPSSEDFGVWTCEMAIDGKIVGAVIDVVNARASPVRKIESPKVFVRLEDQFKVRCSVNAVLNYCWFTSPNGTAFSVTSEGTAENTLKYDGKGFSMGDCGAIIPNANLTDNGDWTCHLGIEKGSEVETEATVTVKVTDTYLIPAANTVYATSNTKLTCRTFLGEEGTLKYCRWVRPNGHGITKEVASRYQLERGLSECSLNILRFENEDIGEWKCVASLTRASDTEEWAAIQLMAAEDRGTTVASVLSIVLGSGLLIIILVGAFFGAMHVYKRRNAKVPKCPPPYYPSDYNIPHGICTSPDPDIPRKDYHY